VPLGCDGARLHGPRSPERERRLLSHKGKNRASPPALLVTAFVPLSLGILGS
jgi:hypothetical protein